MSPPLPRASAQPLKVLRKALLIIFSLLLAYLVVVALWSWAAVDEIMASNPAKPAAPSLSASQTAILLKIEDPTFLTHSGLSLADGQGFTTISSSVARDIFLFGADLDGVKGGFQRFYRGVFACCKKVDIGRDMMALVLNAKVSKQEQLSRYVSNVYMGTHQGGQIRGLAQASNSYFGKALDTLTDSEFAGLVAMIKAPNQFHPMTSRAAYDLRAARVMAIISGQCKPNGWFDTAYQHCATHPQAD